MGEKRKKKKKPCFWRGKGMSPDPGYIFKNNNRGVGWRGTGDTTQIATQRRI